MHIENFVIKEFKCFKDFELKDLRQVNIFLGDNNIGKTSILEALLFDEEPKAFFI
jgi:AAA15 family ATPase/GTPase